MDRQNTKKHGFSSVTGRRLCHADEPQTAAKTGVHGCYCLRDKAVRIREVMARPWVGVCVPLALIPRKAPRSEIYDLVAREARVYHTGIARTASSLVGVRVDVIQSSDVKVHYGFPGNRLPSTFIHEDGFSS